MTTLHLVVLYASAVPNPGDAGAWLAQAGLAFLAAMCFLVWC